MYLWITCSGEQTTQKQGNFSLFHRKVCCDSLTGESGSTAYATMGVWERIHLRSHSLLLFPPQPRHLPGYIRRTSASAHTSGPEGCALHAATSPFTGIRQCAPKAKELTVERHYTRLQERLSTGKSKMPACHGGRSGGSYDLPRRYPAENCPTWCDN